MYFKIAISRSKRKLARIQENINRTQMSQENLITSARELGCEDSLGRLSVRDKNEDMHILILGPLMYHSFSM